MSLAPCRYSGGRVESQGIHLLISQRGNVYHAWGSHLHQANDKPLPSVAPTPLRRLDHTIHSLSCLGDADRPHQKQVRTHGRKRASTPATYRPSPTRQTTRMCHNGSDAPGAAGKGGSDLETSALHCSARDASALASSGIHVCKRTIQKYMRHARTPRQRGQTWATFLQNHAKDIWACDFLQVTDLFFRSLFAFFIIDIHTRQVIHVGVTRSPTDAWTAQQLREATPFGRSPKYLIRDRDDKFGSCFARVAATSGIKILKTPYYAPRANAICERFLGSVRRECLDHLFILQEKQLQRVLGAYVQYFNRARPHQGITQQIPERFGDSVPPDRNGGKILCLPVLEALHHD